MNVLNKHGYNINPLWIDHSTTHIDGAMIALYKLNTRCAMPTSLVYILESQVVSCECSIQRVLSGYSANIEPTLCFVGWSIHNGFLLWPNLPSSSSDSESEIPSKMCILCQCCYAVKAQDYCNVCYSRIRMQQRQETFPRKFLWINGEIFWKTQSSDGFELLFKTFASQIIIRKSEQRAV